MYFSIFKTVIFSLAIIALFSNYESTNVSEMKALDLIVNYPVIQMRKENVFNQFNLTDTIRIYYIGDYIVYGLLPPRRLEDDQKISPTGEYFIYRNGESTGRLYLSQTSTKESGVLQNVDSILFLRAFTGTKFAYPTAPPWVKVDSASNVDGLVEKFAFSPQSADPETPDSLLYYFSRDLSNYPYTFSTQMDSLKNMKLCRIRIKFNQKTYSVNGLKVPEREMFFSIQKKEIVPSDSLVMNLLSRHKGG